MATGAGYGSRRKYPWERWFGNPRTVIMRGQDYHISQSMMYMTIKNNASAKRVKVDIDDIDNGFIITRLDAVEGEGAVSHPDQAPVTR